MTIECTALLKPFIIWTGRMALIKFILVAGAISVVINLSQEEVDEAFTGEMVTLKCENSNTSLDWMTTWLRNSEKIIDVEIKDNGKILLISSIKPSHLGKYTCETEVKGRPKTRAVSAEFLLTVNEPPQPKVILHSGWKEAFTGEMVTLKCENSNTSLDWMTTWLRNSEKMTDVEIKDNGKTLLISSIKPSHLGKYTCETEVKGRPKTRAVSAEFLLTVYEPPQPKVILDSGWKEAFTGEMVTLKCENSITSLDWMTTWLRNSEKMTDVEIKDNGKTLLISSIKPSHLGKYTCETEVKGRPKTRAVSAEFLLTVYEPPQPKVILDSGWKEAFTGEMVTLKCENSITSLDWMTTWLRNSEKMTDVEIKDNGKTLLISSIKPSHLGKYTCETEVKGRPKTRAVSAEFLLTVYEPPQPKVILDSGWKEAFTGEMVTLKCENSITSLDWMTTWLRNSEKMTDVEIKDNDKILLISSIKPSHLGKYTCETEVKHRPKTRAVSAEFLLTVYEPPQPKVILHSGWKEAFTGEMVTLKCENSITSLDWMTTWLRNSEKMTDVEIKDNDKILLISSIKPSHLGKYTCETEVKHRPKTRAVSAEFLLTVYEPPQPKVILHSGWKEAFTGEMVTLKCENSITSLDWMTTWLRNSEKMTDVEIKDNDKILLISSIKPSHLGKYTCETEVKHRPKTRAVSAEFLLTVYEPPQPKVILDSGWKEAFTGEMVTLKCENSITSLDWMTTWLRNSEKMTDVEIKDNDKILLISSIKPSHLGKYTCETEVKHRPKTRAVSAEFLLTVYEPPQPKVILDSGWKEAFTGEMVTLKCENSITSLDWMTTWLRNSEKMTDVEIKDNDKILLISSIKPSHLGKYTCETEVKDRPKTRAVSAEFLLTVYEPPQPKVILHSGWKEAFTGEMVTLKCENSNTSLDWMTTWLRNSEKMTDVEIKDNGTILLISSIKPSHLGKYTCETEVKDRPKTRAVSAEFLLTVYARPSAVLILETSWSDIMSVATLTLKCEVRGQLEWNYTWYKDEIFEITSTEQMYSIKATHETFKSEYKCRGNRTQRPLYSSFSEGFKANNIVLKRKVLLAISGCVVCSMLLLFIGCIALRFKRKTEKKDMVKEDLFFSMTASMTQTSSPLQEYMMQTEPPLDMEECNQTAVLINEPISTVSSTDLDDHIKTEVLLSKDTEGLKSFKVETSPRTEHDGLKSLKGAIHTNSSSVLPSQAETPQSAENVSTFKVAEPPLTEKGPEKD